MRAVSSSGHNRSTVSGFAILAVVEAYATADSRRSPALAGHDSPSVTYLVAWHKTAANACERAGSKSAA